MQVHSFIWHKPNPLGFPLSKSIILVHDVHLWAGPTNLRRDMAAKVKPFWGSKPCWILSLDLRWSFGSSVPKIQRGFRLQPLAKWKYSRCLMVRPGMSPYRFLKSICKMENCDSGEAKTFETISLRWICRPCHAFGFLAQPIPTYHYLTLSDSMSVSVTCNSPMNPIKDTFWE
jgi:hypothetical protein